MAVYKKILTVVEDDINIDQEKQNDNKSFAINKVANIGVSLLSNLNLKLIDDNLLDIISMLNYTSKKINNKLILDDLKNINVVAEYYKYFKLIIYSISVSIINIIKNYFDSIPNDIKTKLDLYDIPESITTEIESISEFKNLDIKSFYPVISIIFILVLSVLKTIENKTPLQMKNLKKIISNNNVNMNNIVKLFFNEENLNIISKTNIIFTDIIQKITNYYKNPSDSNEIVKSKNINDVIRILGKEETTVIINIIENIINKITNYYKKY